MNVIFNSLKHSISLSQTVYIAALLEKFGLKNANPISTPLDPNTKLDKFEPADESVDSTVTSGYAQLIGSLMYLAISTCPDIAFAMNKLTQFTSNP